MTPALWPLLAVAVVGGGPSFDVARFDRVRVLAAAGRYLNEQPVTVTASRSPRSAGGRNEFFSEGDYWWPDPENPDGPYVQRDGMTNPDNFVEHRRALMRLSVQVPALAAAWRLTGDARYAVHAGRHLRAWFLDPETRMAPHLEYAQAIHGITTGRPQGVIDTLHLVEVARAIEALDRSPALRPAEIAGVRGWFREYLLWLTTDENALKERDAKNNHATCWLLQVAAFARLVGDQALAAEARTRFKTVILPNQVAADGSFPEELRRTKPYGYSLFNLEAMAGLAQTLSTPDDDLWTFETADGRGLARAMAYLYPYLRNKKAWPRPPDVMYDAEWPMRQSSLLFAGLELGRPEYIELWKTLPADSTVEEVVRNFFIRQPVLWVAAAAASPATDTVRVESPNAVTAMTMRVVGGRLRWSAALRGRPVIEDSALGIVVDGVDLGEGAALGRTHRYRTAERFPWRGVHPEAFDPSRGVRAAVRHARSGLTYFVQLRAFDDAVAFQIIVPGRGAHVPDAAARFRLPDHSTVWYHGLRDHYEGIYSRKAMADVAEGEWAAPPLTFALPGSGYGAITEAALAGYAGMVLQADGRGGFRERLGHAPPASYPFVLRYKEEEARRLSAPAAIEGTIATPWRVVLMAESLDALVNSDAIASLSPPADRRRFPQGIRTPWVRPGRAVWRYLDGGENTVDGIKEFSRLAAELGFEYNVVEGLWQRWSDAELREVIAYSKARGVSLWLWRHSNTLHDPGERRALFSRLHDLGVAGVKVDFLDHEAREVIDHYHAILRDAAEFQLMVDFHGANKPAGEPRTWPNEMTREGIRGLEYRSMEAWATHDTTWPFTRLLAGHADFTPVVFGERRKETSWAHQIASAAIVTSPLLVYGAHPATILSNPAVDVIRSIPSVWDETRVLPASRIGELALFARRSGTKWFVAAMNGAAAQTAKVDLAFLGKGPYRAVIVRDQADDPAAVEMETRSVEARDALEIPMRAGGGFVARLTR